MTKSDNKKSNINLLTSPLFWIALFVIIICGILLCVKLIPAATSQKIQTDSQFLVNGKWDEGTQGTINEYFELYGCGGPSYQDNTYAVTELEHSTVVGCCEDTVLFYLVDNNLIKIDASKIAEAMTKDVHVDSHRVGVYTQFDDEEDFYNYLSNLAADVQRCAQSELICDQTSAEHDEFVSKFWKARQIIDENCDEPTCALWPKRFFAGYEQSKLYNVAKEALSKYSKPHEDTDPKVVNLESCNQDSLTGCVKAAFIPNINCPNEIRQLWYTTRNNKTDIYVVTETEINIAKAAIDFYDLHNLCNGVYGVCCNIDEKTDTILGTVTCNNSFSTTGENNNAAQTTTIASATDTTTLVTAANNNFGYTPNQNNKWSQMVDSCNNYPSGLGKCELIKNNIAPKYDKNPNFIVAGKDKDYYAATMFKDVKFVLFLNDNDTPVQTGYGVMQVAAMYQVETLRYILKNTNNAGDTMYLMQGIDYNHNTFDNQLYCFPYGSNSRYLMKDNDNFELLRYVRDKKFIVGDIFKCFTTYTSADKSLVNGVQTGFCETYEGYHSIG